MNLSRRFVAALVPAILSLGVWIAVPRAAAGPGSDRVDTHVHLIYLAGRHGSPGDRPVPTPKDECEQQAALLIERMDQNGVARALVLPPPKAARGPADVGTYRDFLAAVRKRPGRLFFLGGGGILNPLIHGSSADQVTEALGSDFERKAEAILADGAKGFGEMAALHLSMSEGHPFEAVTPDHPLFLLLADIAARHDVPIDLHMDALVAGREFPPQLERIRKLNPGRLEANVPAFERLLAHNRKARIVWQHAGSDPVGGMTPDLLRRLLGAHANLYVGIRVPLERPRPGPPAPANLPVDEAGNVRPEWLKLFADFPDRFVVGSDLFVSESAKEATPGPAPRPFEVWKLVDKLPPEIARKLGGENAARIYRLP